MEERQQSPKSPIAAHGSSPVELRERLAAEREGLAFLVYRDEDGAQRLVTLGEQTALTIGRSEECNVCLRWDESVSRLHAEIERVGTHWTIADDGLSRNGTLVAGSPLNGRRRLSDHDVIQIGDVLLVFRDPARSVVATTRAAEHRLPAAQVTEAQRRVLIALCRPFKGGAADAVPATNPEIAAELFLSVAAVKTHMRALFEAFGIADAPQLKKRRQLVTHAFTSGAVSERDL